MFEDKIHITLNCAPDNFESNFGLFIKNKKGGKCSSQVKKRLAGHAQESMISLWYDPKCFNQPFSLPIAQGTFRTALENKTKIELKVFIEGRYPSTYLIIGIITYIVVLLIFGIYNFKTLNFWTIKTVLLIVVPILTLLISLISFRNSVKDMRQEIIRYQRIISKAEKQ